MFGSGNKCIDQAKAFNAMEHCRLQHKLENTCTQGTGSELDKIVSNWLKTTSQTEEDAKWL